MPNQQQHRLSYGCIPGSYAGGGYATLPDNYFLLHHDNPCFAAAAARPLMGAAAATALFASSNNDDVDSIHNLTESKVHFSADMMPPLESPTVVDSEGGYVSQASSCVDVDQQAGGIVDWNLLTSLLPPPAHQLFHHQLPSASSSKNSNNISSTSGFIDDRE
ncbi:hypothetical protein ABZP36_027258 [Zizania latifolia]